MNERVFAIGFLLLAIIAGFGCSGDQSENSDEKYLARVGSSYLTIDEARANIPRFSSTKDSAAALAAYRNQWIHQQLLLEEARKLNITQQKEVQKRLKEVRKEVLISSLKNLITTEYLNRTTVSDEEALQYYREHQQQLVLSERYVKFRHIETANLADARKAREALRNDSSWTAVMHQYSLDARQNITKAGQFWPVSSVLNDVPGMKRYVASLDSGQISPIRRFNGVYHLLQMVDVREQGETADPRWFIDQLKEWLIREKQLNYYNSYIKNLYLSAKKHNEVEVYNVSTLPFNDKIDSTKTPKSNE